MNRFSTMLICLSVLLSSGCPRHAALPPETGQRLEPVYIEKFPDGVTAFEFSNDGKTFILAGNHSFLYLYDATTFKKLASINDSTNDFRPRGIGYIDDNTWYLATRHPDTHLTTRFSIRNIKPQREIYQYDIPIVFGKLSTVANEDYIVHSETMLDWRNGKTYQVEFIDDASIDYELTEYNQVVTRNNHGNLYQIDDPIKKKSTTIDVGSPRGILSPYARYALVVSDFGGCVLLQLPQKTKTGRCGKWGKDWTQAAFQRDNKIFAVSSKNEIYVYAIQPFKLLMSATMPKEVVLLSLGEGRLAAKDNFGGIKVWDITEKRLLGEYPQNIEGTSAGKLVFQPYGNKLALTNYGQLTMFDLNPASAKNGER